MWREQESVRPNRYKHQEGGNEDKNTTGREGTRHVLHTRSLQALDLVLLEEEAGFFPRVEDSASRFFGEGVPTAGFFPRVDDPASRFLFVPRVGTSQS